MTVGALIHGGSRPSGARVLRHFRDAGHLVVRVQLTAPPGLLGCPGLLTYQTDHLDPNDHTGWTVTVTGSAQTVTDACLQARYCLPLRARPEDRHEQLVRIRPRIVTGYRLVRDPS
ncbi:hypothetical protein OG806_07345 [Streptomyces sp. NBC_00882]|uniref:hypothetical protein n=1 Tax=Streptomyces sp. NBC_00882 TaxID=2975856 RepID=UPI003865E7E8|nr:hypothetical protein OG806_07345 [Streptomyces sp. NBC_00882]